jgi:hypothetical protein
VAVNQVKLDSSEIKIFADRETDGVCLRFRRTVFIRIATPSVTRSAIALHMAS